MAHDLAAPKAGRSAGTMVRYVLGGLPGIAILVVLFGERGDLAAARHELRHWSSAGWPRPRAAACLPQNVLSPG